MTYNLEFEKAIAFVLKWEGGLSVDPDDPGGTTNFGISQRAYPSLDIPNLTLDQAKDIYYRDYWLRSSANIQPSPLCTVHFDSSVNCGVKRAMQFLSDSLSQDGEPLQTALYYLGLRGQYYNDLAVKNPKLSKYLIGWHNRINDLQKYISS